MKTVLIIEDDKVIRENTAEILSLSNYKVLTAADGKKGMQLAIEHRPDIIICDIMMPQLDGFGVIHMLQKRPETQNIPFIFLTARIERDDIRKGMSMGADDYITKPFTEMELLTAIETKLRKREQLKREFAPMLEELNTLLAISDSGETLKSLTTDTETSKFTKRQIVYRAGVRPDKLYFIKKGKIKTFKTNEDGKELIINLYSENDFFGHIAMLEDDVYKETAQALEETEVVIIPRAHFEKLISSNPEIVRKFVKALANNVTEKEQQLLNMAYNSLRKKVADALLAINQKYGVNENNSVIRVNRMSLAGIAGTAKESVVRVLADFKDEGLIEIVENHDIVLKDIKKLQNVIN